MASSNPQPILSSLTAYAEITSLRTNLSFVNPTSLTAFPSLSWLQTPWSPSFPPLSSAHISAISHHFSLPPSVVENALPFGSTPSHGPDLFVLFPQHTAEKEVVVTDERFLRIWHDQILKPAFDRAWQDSAQASISGAFKDAFVHILPATGISSSKDALPFTPGFRSRLRSRAAGHVSAPWPEHNPNVMKEAWDAIKGMVEGHPDLKNFQNPILLAVQRDEIWFGEQMGAQGVYAEMGKSWDGWVDVGEVEEGSLRVVLEVVVGVKKEVRKEVVPLGVGMEF